MYVRERLPESFISITHIKRGRATAFARSAADGGAEYDGQ